MWLGILSCASFSMWFILLAVSWLEVCLCSEPITRTSNSDYGFDIDRSLKLDLTDPKKQPYHFLSTQTSNLNRTNWNDSNNLVEAIYSQQPTVFTSAVSHWSALQWDLWDLCSSWPILLDVLVLDQSLFLLHEVSNCS